MSQLVSAQEEKQGFFQVISKQEEDDICNEIICGKKLKFKCIDSDKFFKLLEAKNISTDGITHFNILQYNFNQIILQLAEYFPDIKINKFANSPCISECKIKQEEFTHKFDLYIVMTKDDKIYEYGYDFFTHLSDIPENKYSHSKTLLDDYQYFLSEDIQSNEDIVYYLNENLFKILTAICALKNDEYKLAEIMFVKSNQENMTQKQMLKELGYFLRVINWKKSNEIDLEDLFDELELINNDTEKPIKYNDLTKIIEKISNDFEFQFNKKQKTINFEIFESFLLNVTNFSSRTLMYYKKTYLKAMKILMDSLKIIIELVKEINMKKTFTPDYINNLIKFHLDEYKEQNVIDKIYYKKINEKKILFENLFNDINTYCDKNEHDEDKLDKIKSDFDLLYDCVFNI